jgi:hypothetical protein
MSCINYTTNDANNDATDECEKNHVLDKLIYSIHNLIKKEKRKFSEITPTVQNGPTKPTDLNNSEPTHLDMINALNIQNQKNRYIKKYKLLLSNLYKNEYELRLTKLSLTEINFCDIMSEGCQILVRDIYLLPFLENKIIQLENNQIVFNFNKIQVENHFWDLYNLNIQNIYYKN